MNPRLAAWLVSSALMSTVLPASAEDAPVRKMTLTEALAYAHAHQPDLRAALGRIKAADAATEVSTARWYPVILGTAQLAATTTNNTTGSYLGIAGFDNPRISSTRTESQSTATFVPRASSLLGANLRQEVYDFGRIHAETTASELNAAVARDDAATTKLYLDYGIEEAYFAVYAAKSIVDAADKARARATVHRDFARERFEAGKGRPIDLTRAEAVLDRYELERIRGRRNVVTAQSILAAQVGVADRLLDIEGTAPAPTELPSLETTLADASARNPELRAALDRIRVQEQTTKAIATETRPNLFFSATLSGNAGGAAPTGGERPIGAGLLPVVPNWDVGVVLAWPLFDQTVAARAAQSRVEADVARERAAALRLKIVAAVEQAWNDVAAARDALPVLGRQVAASVANYDQATARFEVGLGDAVELADAEELRVQAEIQLALGSFDLARARAALARATAEDR